MSINSDVKKTKIENKTKLLTVFYYDNLQESHLGF